MALYGLKSMTFETPEENALLEALTRLIDYSALPGRAAALGRLAWLRTRSDLYPCEPREVICACEKGKQWKAALRLLNGMKSVEARLP